MNDLAVAAPAQPGDVGKRGGVLLSERGDELRESLLALASDRVVRVRVLQHRLRADRRKVAAPDDRRRGGTRPNGFREGDRRLQLRAAHDTHADRVDATCVERFDSDVDEIFLDVAVDNLGRRLILQRRRETQDRERKTRVAFLGNPGIDQQDSGQCTHNNSSG